MNARKLLSAALFAATGLMALASAQAQTERRLVEHEGAEREDRQDQPGRPVGLVKEQLAEQRNIDEERHIETRNAVRELDVA